jgi:uncharacterized protein (TIGR03067 family)
MKRVMLLTLVLAMLALQSMAALGQVAPTGDPAADHDTPAEATAGEPTAAPPSTAPLPATAPPAGATSAGPPVASTEPPVGPPAGTPPAQPLLNLPLTIPGPGATIPPATGTLTPQPVGPAGTAPPRPQNPLAELAPFLKDGLQFTAPALPGTTIEAGFEGNPRYIASQNVAITWSEGKDAAWGYSKSLGRWAKQSLDPPATEANEVPIVSNNIAIWPTGTAIYGFSGAAGRWAKQSLDPPATKEMPALNDSVAVLQVGATFYGFSGAASRWDVLKLPAESKATIVIDDEYALVTDREALYTFSAATGQWSSPQDATPQIGDATIGDASGTSGASEVRSFQLRHANAVTLESTLLRQLFADELRLGANHTGLGDTIIARGSPQALDQLEALLKVLDRPAQPATGNGRSPELLSGDMGYGMEEGMMGVPGVPGGMSGRPASRAQLQRDLDDAERRAAELAKQLRENQPRGRSGQSPAALEQAVAQAFTARQNLHQHDLAALETRLKSTRETLTMRERIKQQIIERRVADLLNPNLKWDAPPTAVQLNAARPTTGAADSPAVRDTLAVRRDKLRERWDIVFNLYKGGRVNYQEAIRAANEAYESDTAIAVTTEVQIQAAERHVERSRSLLQLVEEKHHHEVEPIQAKLAAEALVLNAEAILATAQGTANRLSARPTTSPGPTTETTDIPPVLRFANDLRGTWLQVAQERNGEASLVKPGTVFTLTFDGNRYMLRQGAEAYARGTFKVGSEVGRSRELDTVRTWLKGETEETQRPQQELGLAQLNENTLQWCYGGMRANERPDNLRTKQDDGRLLTEWRRVSLDPLSDEQLRSIDLADLTSEENGSLKGATAIAVESTTLASGEISSRSAEAVTVHIRGLDEAIFQFGDHSHRLDEKLIFRIPRSSTFHTEVSQIPSRDGLTLHAEWRAGQDMSRMAGTDAEVNVLVTAEDLDRVANGLQVVKAYFAPHEGRPYQVESLDSTRLDPGVDPVREANKRGNLLVVLTLTKARPAADGGGAAAKPGPAAVEAPAPVPSAGGNRPSAGDSPLILARPEEFQERLSELHHKVVAAQQIVDQRNEEFTAGKSEQRLINNAVADLRSWQNKLDLAKAEYEAQIRLLESELESNQLSAEAAQREFERAEQLAKQNAISSSERDNARLAMQQAQAKLDRARTLLELYRKVGELSLAEPAADSQPTKPMPAEPTTPAGEAAEPK